MDYILVLFIQNIPKFRLASATPITLVATSYGSEVINLFDLLWASHYAILQIRQKF